ncbi:winged helix-turn-helix domain-containing protein [Leucobacter triazinivorans]|uniref:Winged helix-turn-helix domain-containing protein n=1 Tax=Leucobacter triazinivorans TaxID=1784719 RepID=A0A4V0Z187_9MICO|nr:crosslink repair DNA glycosylase YcaQ family protein [Leucobacter triazinivorans]QBE47549.1 winged helix-turn-helix domain-containing protein [Leucobacter triazinivorans]
MSSAAPISLRPAEARRIALAAQGFAGTARFRRHRPFDPALRRLHVLQIDSVNVFARSHYLPLFSRHGDYDPIALDRHLWQSGEFTEYWAHEAAFVPVNDRALFGWRMEEYRERSAVEGRTDALAASAARVRDVLADGQPRLVRELETEPRGPRGPWWDWSDTKRAVELLFAQGEVVAAGRENFQRRYTLAEHALPASALRSVPRQEAQRALVERAAQSLGVATLADVADYHRLKTADARAALRDLEDEGLVIPVRVAGWTRPSGSPEPAWMHRDGRLPARLAPDALLTPFDPVVWFRPRAERLFDFHYRIEIYTPKERRRYGYYCLPLMVGGRLAGRIDLKADRTDRALLVQAAWQEDRAPARTPEVAVELLQRAASWQGLHEVRVSGIGNLRLPQRFDAG